jgi:hypothetical protein
MWSPRSRQMRLSKQPDAGEFLENRIIVGAVRRWIETVVVDLNLCPFAGRELVKDRVRLAVTPAITEEQLLAALQKELELLSREPSVETTLLIHPDVLHDFYDYNRFLSYAEGLLVQMKLEGVYQIASFHPDYQFAGTETADAENYTNRSPYPMLHLIREESLERAIAAYPDVDKIPLRNTELMNTLGKDKLQKLLQACFDGSKSE